LSIFNDQNTFGMLLLKDAKVWDFEFRSLCFVCYLVFVIWNF